MSQRATPHVTVGDLRCLSVTLPQAARLLKIDVAQIRKAVDRKIVVATTVMRGDRSIRTLDGIDVLGLRIGQALDSRLSRQVYSRLKETSDSEQLALAFESHPTGQDKLFGYVVDVAAETMSDMRALQALSEHIDEQGILKKARVEAYRIAALVAGGMSLDDIIEDYPGLDPSMVEAAVTYAAVNPKHGRPYPSVTAKSALRKGGGGGLAAAFAEGRDSSG